MAVRARRSPSLGVKLVASGIVTLILLVLLEGAARLLGVGLDQARSFGQFEEQVHVLLRRGLFERDPDLFWKLKPGPNVETPIAPGGLRVNDLGLRGPEWPRSPSPGNIRIVSLGDSCTFGWSVEENSAYPIVLGKDLRDRGLHVEVINAGVPGFTSLQGLRFLKRDLLAFRPRVVTLCFGWNELWPARGQPDVSQAVGGALVTTENFLERSHLYRLLRRGYVRVRSDFGEGRTEQTVPRVSPPQFKGILEELAALCKREGIELCLVTQPARHSPHAGCWSPPQHELLGSMYAVMREVARDRGVLLVDAAAALEAQPQDATFVDCVHPSPAGHEVMAKSLADALEPTIRRAEETASP